MVRVNIGKRVDYETLETALIKAAEEVGWRADIEDSFQKEYKLGSVEEVKAYDNTMIRLKGKYLTAARICINKEGCWWPTDNFDLWSGLPFGFASERKIKQYLDAVSRNL